LGITIAEDVKAERAAFAESLIEVGLSSATECGQWTTLDLAAHLAGEERNGCVTPSSLNPSWNNAFRCQDRRCWSTPHCTWSDAMDFMVLVDRLRRPVPRLRLRPLVVPLTLFEYWTHHDDLIGFNAGVHAAPAVLIEAIPPYCDISSRNCPVGVRVTARTGDGIHQLSVGPTSRPEVILAGTPSDLVRWLTGRSTPGEVTTAVQNAHPLGPITIGHALGPAAAQHFSHVDPAISTPRWAHPFDGGA
jgi:uncharacterized protein (TIGR03083 family)